jgi:hypothetical protein
MQAGRSPQLMRDPLGRRTAINFDQGGGNMRHALTSLAISLLAVTVAHAQKPPASSATPVEQQFDAYNDHDAKRMAKSFAPVFYRGTLGDTLMRLSRDTLAAKMATFFARAPQVHAELVDRIVHGAFIIDREHVTGLPGGESSEWIMIYEVRDGQIVRNWVIEPPEQP